MVIGSRFKGTIHPGAMPWPNRYIGNPVLTGMLNTLFHSGVSDAHCGLRAVRRDALPTLKLSATGMEFASEMVIKAGKRRLRVEEIPIDYYPRIGESKLSRVGDAWRHVRFMLVYSPTFLFMVPGAARGRRSGSGGDRTRGRLRVSATRGRVSRSRSRCSRWSESACIQLGLYARTYAVIYLGDEGPQLERLWRRFRLEHGLALAGVTLAVGLRDHRRLVLRRRRRIRGSACSD